MRVDLVTAFQTAGIGVQHGVSMQRLTSFHIGGPCELLLTPADEAQLRESVALCEQEKIPFMLLGNGSNLLVSDEGIEGAVILTSGARQLQREGCTLRAGCGLPLSALCRQAAEWGLGGLEFAYGIPGTVGGAVVMNAGAYGGEISSVCRRVRVLTSQQESLCLSGDSMGFGYRHSAFSSLTVLEASFELTEDVPALIRERMEDFMKRRKEKQPLDLPSAGSVFKRPEGFYAGRLIEQAGLKGRQIGGARVSDKHAGFIVNTGAATCREVLELIELIRQTVKERLGVTLECEIKVCGR